MTQEHTCAPLLTGSTCCSPEGSVHLGLHTLGMFAKVVCCLCAVGVGSR